MTLKEFQELTGEHPVDVLGQDWRNTIDDWAEQHNLENLEQEATGN